MTDWKPEDGPFPKPKWVPRRQRTERDWYDLTCWQRNEISRLTAERDEKSALLREAYSDLFAASDRAVAAEAELARRDRMIEARLNAAAYAEPKDLR
jgi:hypothetical protein